MGTNIIRLDDHRQTTRKTGFLKETPIPIDGSPDPAQIIGLALRYGRICGDTGCPVPNEILVPLFEQASRGCRASELVLAWIYRQKLDAAFGGDHE